MHSFGTSVDLENCPIPWFSNFRSSLAGLSRIRPSGVVLSFVVQGDDIFLHNLARCAIAAPLRNPTAGLGWSTAFIASGFAQKTDEEPVGGRGISAFLQLFFFTKTFEPKLTTLSKVISLYDTICGYSAYWL
ncbi:hypothetical protein [Pseudomonas viridiflava]|uniref:hypothetical protein n=1 Tax=Pseudomonas viridiflava TaxID=33069 RepID=UPI00197D4CFB|nr:hypothetical protein [Pseudomonas viridiflava]